MQIYFDLVGHNESKMQIEHTNRSMEDKPKTEIKNGGVMAVSRMLQPTKSPEGQPNQCVTQPQDVSSRILHQDAAPRRPKRRTKIVAPSPSKREENASTKCVCVCVK